jgi:hypothetical protein
MQPGHEWIRVNVEQAHTRKRLCQSEVVHGFSTKLSQCRQSQNAQPDDQARRQNPIFFGFDF